jgi:hypothetical protein
MGKVFLSYASEDFLLAKDIQMRLRQHGHDVFFDEDVLNPSDGYDKIIQKRIKNSDVMIFLCSQHSLGAGRYTLTELEMVQRLWPNPAGRLLPVLLGDSEFKDLPSYLKGLSAYKHKGDPVAEIAHLAENMLAKQSRARLWRWSAWIVAAIVAAILLLVATGLLRSWMGSWVEPDKRAFFASQLDDMQCGWLDVGEFSESPEGIEIEVFGPAGLPGSSIVHDLEEAADDAGIAVARIDAHRVATIERSQCAVIDLIKDYRRDGISRLRAEGQTVEGTAYFKLIFDPGSLAANLHVYSIDPDGSVQFAQDRETLISQSVVREDGQREAYYRAGHQGWGGFLILESDAEIDPEIVPALTNDVRIQTGFEEIAGRNNWRFELVWLNTEE